ncbi:hypothetical protein [Desulfotalea psychrophila]|nr:hypothetical protein [Desulfotalea psychrophila]
MKNKTMKQNAGSYLAGMMLGVISVAALIYILNISGTVAISSTNSLSLIPVLYWCHDNLGFSIIPFALIACLYILYLFRLQRALDSTATSPEKIYPLEEKIDLLITLFFGIGVIWTAIGMRNALLVSLGSLDADTAAQKGAFSILKELIDGGILLSLSTTIVGGIGGYLMRMIKAWMLGSKLYKFAIGQQLSEHLEIIAKLDNIASLLKDERGTT